MSGGSNNDDDNKVPSLQAPSEAVQEFVENVGLLWCNSTEIEILDEPPTALVFLRDFVAASRPCLIRHAILGDDGDDEPLVLTIDDLVQRHPDLTLTVDASPDGHADCLRKVRRRQLSNNHGDNDEEEVRSTTTFDMFVQPEERSMSLSQFREGLRASREQQQADVLTPHEIRERIFSCSFDPDTTTDDEATHLPAAAATPPVLYYSRQNDCLRQELGPLWDSLPLPTTLDWAQAAFGTGPPDAVNLWMGHERGCSATHKDHYENLFYVASGEKVFDLSPPADAPFWGERPHPSGRFVFCQATGTWKVRPDGDNNNNNNKPEQPQPQLVHWIDDDSSSLLRKFTHPVTVHVRSGEMLYLPALWFHRVTQTCETVGINYWYDMKFNNDWCYFRLLQQMVLVPPPATVATASEKRIKEDNGAADKDES